MKIVIRILLVILISELNMTAVSAQKEDHTWVMGENVIMDFNGSSPTIRATPNPFKSHEGAAAVSDSLGNLLLYTNGQNVYGRDGNVLPNGDGLDGSFSAATCILIKAPGCNTKYYLFTTGSHEENKLLKYSVIDLSLNKGLGDINPGDKNIPLSGELTSEKLDLTYADNNADYWLVAHEAVGKKFLAFRITKLGISKPIVSEAGFDFPSTFSSAGCMKISPKSNFIGITYHDYAFSYFGNNMQVLKFNNRTGEVGPVCYETRLPYFSVAFDIAFSPNENFAYVTTLHSYLCQGVYCVQYDLKDANPVTNTFLLSGNQSLTLGIELAPDGKIYLAHTDLNYLPSSYLSRISNPDEKGSLCLFEPDIVHLPPGTGSLTNLCFSYPSHNECNGACEVSVKADCMPNGMTRLTALTAGSPVLPVVKEMELDWNIRDKTNSLGYLLKNTNPVFIPSTAMVNLTFKRYSWPPNLPQTIENARICKSILKVVPDSACSGICSDFIFSLSSCGDHNSENIYYPDSICKSICTEPCEFIVGIFDRFGKLIDDRQFSISWSNGGKGNHVRMKKPYYNNLSVKIEKDGCIWYGRYIYNCQSKIIAAREKSDLSNGFDLIINSHHYLIQGENPHYLNDGGSPNCDTKFHSKAVLHLLTLNGEEIGKAMNVDFTRANSYSTSFDNYVPPGLYILVVESVIGKSMIKVLID